VLNGMYCLFGFFLLLDPDLSTARIPKLDRAKV
jgi:hypothetical protein